MFQHQGIWLPDGEKHFPAWMDKNGEIVDGRGTYQIQKWRACLPWIKNWRAAVDVGAHVGFWTLQMLPRFYRVDSFEPMAEFRECFERNTEGFTKDGVTRFFPALHPIALGAQPGCIRMNYNQADSGNTHVGGDGDTEMHTLDSFEFRDVDYVKVDCEGYEHHVIEGARETLLRCKPCVIVEQKQSKMAQNYGTSGTPAVDLLRDMGAILRKEMGGDYILSWE